MWVDDALVSFHDYNLFLWKIHNLIYGKPEPANFEADGPIDVDVLSVSRIDENDSKSKKNSRSKKDNRTDSFAITIEELPELPSAYSMSLAYTEDQIHNVLFGGDQCIRPVLVPHSQLLEIYSIEATLSELHRQEHSGDIQVIVPTHKHTNLLIM